VCRWQGNRFAVLPLELQRCRRLHYLRWGAQKVAAEAAAFAAAQDEGREATLMHGEDTTSRGGVAAGMAAEEAQQEGAEGFASDTLTVLELEANGQTSLPPMHPSNSVLVALLASFNRLGGAPLQLARHGASLKKLHLGCNGITDDSLAAVCSLF
jgi:hypothetical protein